MEASFVFNPDVRQHVSQDKVKMRGLYGTSSVQATGDFTWKATIVQLPDNIMFGKEMEGWVGFSNKTGNAVVAYVPIEGKWVK